MAAHTAPGGGLDVLEALLAGRRELAQLLGAPSWAHYQVLDCLWPQTDRHPCSMHHACASSKGSPLRSMPVATDRISVYQDTCVWSF
jgi:hypothetical protein